MVAIKVLAVTPISFTNKDLELLTVCFRQAVLPEPAKVIDIMRQDRPSERHF
jgi:hypothetical protein